MNENFFSEEELKKISDGLRKLPKENKEIRKPTLEERNGNFVLSFECYDCGTITEECFGPHYIVKILFGNIKFDCRECGKRFRLKVGIPVLVEEE